MNRLGELKKELKKLSNPKKASNSALFFKTGKGEYGEGEVFLGITVPIQRQVAKRFVDMSLNSIQSLLKSKIHEYRFTALEILVFQFEAAGEKERKKIFEFYITNSALMNNWDLVDTSAPYIVGEYLLHRPKAVLYRLVKSKNIWQRRIAIVSTYTFIRMHEFSDIIRISELLLSDTHDLIHKAVGWMLREMGKRDEKVLKGFLQKHYKTMPRTALRYAIEKFSLTIRKKYLQGEV